MEGRALIACAVAFAVAALVTPLAARLAVRVGAVDEPRDRGLAARSTPLLGGLAMLAGVLVAALLFLPLETETRGILGGAVFIAAVGAIDDARELRASVKLLGQGVAALILVEAGVVVDNVTLPFLGALDFAHAGAPLTVLGLVAVMNVVNLSDGVDGLAAGVCAIAAATFAVIAFDLLRDDAGVLAAITAGVALGFLVHNFHPASVFMGDCGSNLLGFLLGAIAVQGSLKTNAVLALVVPLVVLAVPFLDTSFVVAKRLKYRRPIHRADANHFHHRFDRIGFSQRRTVLYLYAWTLAMAGCAVAMRFVPYLDESKEVQPGWAALMAVLLLGALGASVYVVWVLEILKFRRLRAWQLRRVDPQTSEHEIDVVVERELETGEFAAFGPDGGTPSAPKSTPAPESRSFPRGGANASDP